MTSDCTVLHLIFIVFFDKTLGPPSKRDTPFCTLFLRSVSASFSGPARPHVHVSVVCIIIIIIRRLVELYIR